MSRQGPTSISIADYINNYAFSVDEMVAKRPVPKLEPTVPFPDPYLRPISDDVKRGPIEHWPCRMGKPAETIKAIKARTVRFYPRRRDWFHDWAEKMYRIGEFGAKQEK